MRSAWASSAAICFLSAVSLDMSFERREELKFNRARHIWLVEQTTIGSRQSELDEIHAQELVHLVTHAISKGVPEAANSIESGH